MIAGLELWANTYLDVLGKTKNAKGTQIHAVCPFCGKGEKHFAINIDTGAYQCFAGACGERGYVTYLVPFLDENVPSLGGKTFLQRRRIVFKYLESFTEDLPLEELRKIYREERKETAALKKVKDLRDCFPGLYRLRSFIEEGELVKSAPEAVEEGHFYLETRHIPTALMQQIDPYVGTEGPLEDRVVFPVKDSEGYVATFVGRSFVGHPLRYYNGKTAEGWTPTSQLVYGLNRVEPKSSIVLVEGIFDALAIWGLTAVALFGKLLSTTQAELILSKEPNEVVVLLDPPSIKDRPDPIELACGFVGLVNKVRIGMMPEGLDPSEAPDEAKKIIKAAPDFYEVV